jgi:predicted RNase H-like nuclease (RuvC/YqgF family)
VKARQRNKTLEDEKLRLGKDAWEMVNELRAKNKRLEDEITRLKQEISTLRKEESSLKGEPKDTQPRATGDTKPQPKARDLNPYVGEEEL